MALSDRPSAWPYLLAAGAVGSIAGIGSLGMTPAGRDMLAAKSAAFSIAMGWQRARNPQPGDYWSGCDGARAAGTAPIYRGEPGYRDGMDGDNDGVACEPYH